MIWLQFLATALVIVFAGVRLARYGDVLGEKIGLGRTWIGVVLLAATTSLPELFAGFGATAVSTLPDIAVGNVQLGAELARQTGLGEAFVGGLFIAVVTSLPEIVVSLTAVRIGAIDLAIGNVLGSIMFNLVILGLDDLFYRPGPLLAAVDSIHSITILALVTMNALFLIGLTYRVMTKRFVVTWDTGAIAAVYVTTVGLTYLLS